MKLVMLENLKQATGEVLNLFTYLKNVPNVVCVFLFALMMLFL